MLRFIIEVLLFVILLPFIIIIEILWLFHCIRTAKMFDYSKKEALKVWCEYLKKGLNMNKDFIINGL